MKINATVPTPPSQIEETELPEGMEQAKANKIPAYDEFDDLNAIETALRAKRDAAPEPTLEQVDAIAQQSEAQILQILNRGVIGSMLETNENRPDGLVERWSRNSDSDINRMKAMGFWVDKVQEWDGSNLHPSPDGKYIVGDLVRVVTTKEQYALIQRVKEGRKLKRRRESRRIFHKQNRDNKDQGGHAVPIQTFEG